MRSPIIGSRSAAWVLAAGLVVAAVVALSLLLRPAGVSPAAASGVCTDQRPYSSSGPWNTPVGGNAQTHPRSAALVGRLAGTRKFLTSDVDQYTIAIYCTASGAPRSSVQFSGYFSSYVSGSREGHGWAPLVPGLPIPRGLQVPTGSDGQVVVWDQVAGIEYGFWRFAWNAGRATATNGYAVRTDPSSPGRFADGLAGRGAGTPYLAGLVRARELEQGVIKHALAFAYPYPSREFVYPAAKSDGRGNPERDLPEGSRLQLDPTLTRSDLTRMGVNGPGLVLAKALQDFGMYVVDNSGSAKVYVEDRVTARWGADVGRNMLGKIPWDRFRVIQPATPR